MKDHKKEKRGSEEEDVKITEDIAGDYSKQTFAESEGKMQEDKGHESHKHKDSKHSAEEAKSNIEEKLNEKLEVLNDKYIRLAAEFDNYRRRTAKERLDLVLTASEETIKGVLPVLDDLERALDLFRKAEGDHSVAIEGTELIYNKLMTYLTSKGLKIIESTGKDLDTDFHEAIAQLPAPDKKLKNKIIEVVQQGYTLNSKVIRFAKVVVGI